MQSPSAPIVRPHGSASALRCSVIIPVFRGGKHFAACLASVSAALREEDELIVVANGEGDGAWRKGNSHRARIVRSEANVGPARARNLGARAATGDLLIFIDADVTVRPDCVSRIATAFGNQSLSALIGSYDDAPGEQNFLSQFKNLFHHYVHQHGGPEASTFWGACGAIRRDVFLEIGGFDEEYPVPSIEDIELGYRLRAAGHRIRLAHDLQVKHWKRWDALSLVKSDLFDRAAPWTELILQQRIQEKKPVANDLNLGLTYRLSLVTSFLFLGTIAVSIFFRSALVVLPPLIAIFLLLNWPLLRFFKQKRGWLFCCAAVPWRFIYDLCSGLGFGYGVARFLGRGRVVSRRRKAFEAMRAPSRALP